VKALLVLVAAVLALAPAALASERHPTLAELEQEVVCPTCHTTLALSSSPIADRMRTFIRARIAAGDTKSEINAKLVAEFGQAVLAAPPRSGFNLLAWVLPLAGAGIGAVALGLLARRWARARVEPVPPASLNGSGVLPPDLDRRVDEALARYDG